MKAFWSVFLIHVEDESIAKQEHNDHLSRLLQGGMKVIDHELRPCFLQSETLHNVNGLHEIQADVPELAAAANFEIEQLEEDEGI